MNEVRIMWTPERANISQWNELCAQIVERFGLPGDRYTTEVCADWMGFYFKDSRDGFMCKIFLSEYL